ETDIGIAFMMMNLNKYCQRRWLKGRFLLLKILKRTKKRSRFFIRIIYFLSLKKITSLAATNGPDDL
ncbi:hypothetical protein, partial [Lactobacillus crispatus]|uniref:hypothetical protein n=1 Tax=Lactobacillus crispatus TaxID=47770 RepID=UPI0030FC082F